MQKVIQQLADLAAPLNSYEETYGPLYTRLSNLTALIIQADTTKLTAQNKERANSIFRARRRRRSNRLGEGGTAKYGERRDDVLNILKVRLI